MSLRVVNSDVEASSQQAGSSSNTTSRHPVPRWINARWPGSSIVHASSPALETNTELSQPQSSVSGRQRARSDLRVVNPSEPENSDESRKNKVEQATQRPSIVRTIDGIDIVTPSVLEGFERENVFEPVGRCDEFCSICNQPDQPFDHICVSCTKHLQQVNGPDITLKDESKLPLSKGKSCKSSTVTKQRVWWTAEAVRMFINVPVSKTEILWLSEKPSQTAPMSTSVVATKTSPWSLPRDPARASLTGRNAPSKKTPVSWLPKDPAKAVEMFSNLDNRAELETEAEIVLNQYSDEQPSANARVALCLEHAGLYQTPPRFKRLHYSCGHGHPSDCDTSCSSNVEAERW